MYKTYDFKLVPKNVYVVGDIHGEFKLLTYNIKRYDIKDSIIIVAGDCGFGFEKPEYYNQLYNKLKKTLILHNVILLFIRGNHDDAEYFNGNLSIDHTYFKTIADYSILLFENFTVLCVGGGISIDRKQRIKKEFRMKSVNKQYWENEIPIYKPEILNQIKKDNKEINIMITHSCPSFAPMINKIGIDAHIALDLDLSKDLEYERKTMTQIYDHVIEDEHPLELYVYGHFHEHIVSYSKERVKFVMLDRVYVENNSWDIYPIINN